MNQPSLNKLQKLTSKIVSALNKIEMDENGVPKYEKMGTGLFWIILAGMSMLALGAVLYALFV